MIEVIDQQYVSESKLIANGINKKEIKDIYLSFLPRGYKLVLKILKTKVNDNLKFDKRKLAKKATNFFQEVSILERIKKIDSNVKFGNFEGTFYEVDTESKEITSLETLSVVGEYSLEEFIKARNQKNWSREIHTQNSIEIQEMAPYNESEVICFLVDILEGLSILHNNRIFLNDLKPTSIIYDPELRRYLIGDFCNCRIVKSEDCNQDDELQASKYFFNPPSEKYSSPEKTLIYDSFRDKYRNLIPIDLKLNPFKSDVYSLGIIVDEMLGNPEKERISEPLYTILEKLKSKDWRKRPTSSMILKEINDIIKNPLYTRIPYVDEEKYLQSFEDKKSETDNFKLLSRGFERALTSIESTRQLETELVNALKRYQGFEQKNHRLFINLRFRLGNIYLFMLNKIFKNVLRGKYWGYLKENFGGIFGLVL